jgi:transposase-like protein
VGNKRVGRYPEAFRRMAVERMRNCANVSALARELEIDRAMLYQWQRLAGEQETDLTATSPVRELRKQVRDLKRLLAEKTLEVDFFKGALQKVEARRRSGGDSGETVSTTKSGR